MRLFKILRQYITSFAKLYLILLAALLLTACASTKDPAEEFKGQSAQQIYQGAEEALAKGNYSTAVRHYEGLDTLYPFSEYSEQAMLDSIDAYYQSGDQASAAAAAARFIHVYPASPHIDYAYYMKGSAEMVQDRTWPQRYLPLDISARDLESDRKAYMTFATLVQQYPASHYAFDARQRMIYLRNLLAQHELEVGQFYYDRHAYVASANRANQVLEHYEGTPAEKPAIELLVKAYSALNQPEEAKRMQELLALNFPDTRIKK